MASFLNILSFTLLIVASPFNSLKAKDLGIFGHLFTIEEEDFLESLKNKVNQLSNGQLDELKARVQKHYVACLCTPQPVQDLKKASSYRLFHYDPTICSSQEIKDHQGTLIVSKGKCVNPLTAIFALDDLLFFDGSDLQQIAWAKNFPLAKWVLTNGKPLELEEQENKPIYFDQKGMLTQRFGIQHVPAKVSREDLKLRIEEIPL